ncbi:hypothetical protein FA95DRAFT_1611296 [Auriscalpium vulgare]|uniref:Uncharacterized protein n=1 Tax=Auriscalpium vulgare TaxID=40419 RepID=A0ACB8RAF5_9AGAM|nr:hypothetical protein FA95DRAFT_1611296 [Auriscalpium vulgare]
MPDSGASGRPDFDASKQLFHRRRRRRRLHIRLIIFQIPGPPRLDINCQSFLLFSCDMQPVVRLTSNRVTVIDWVYSSPQHADKTLCGCALVCSVWVPDALAMLFRLVLSSEEHLSLLLLDHCAQVQSVIVLDVCDEDSWTLALDKCLRTLALHHFPYGASETARRRRAAPSLAVRASAQNAYLAQLRRHHRRRRSPPTFTIPVPVPAPRSVQSLSTTANRVAWGHAHGLTSRLALLSPGWSNRAWLACGVLPLSIDKQIPPPDVPAGWDAELPQTPRHLGYHRWPGAALAYQEPVGRGADVGHINAAVRAADADHAVGCAGSHESAFR